MLDSTPTVDFIIITERGDFMKMKELTALTGISERTIYYYIDDGVFVPEKRSESYTGRKSYDYTENDVRQLKQIALLRKYDFTIKDIKLLKKEQISISDVLERNIEEAKENIEEKSQNISAMESALGSNPKNLDELCVILSNPTIEKMPAISDGKTVTIWSDIKLVLRALGILGLWILFFITAPEQTVFKFLFFTMIYFIPLLLDTVAFILEVTEKGGIIRLISIILRVIMAAVFVLSFVSMYRFSIKEDSIEKNAKLFSSISAEAFVGIPEDENTVYVNNDKKLDARPEAEYAFLPVLINSHCYLKHIGMNLVDTDMEYVLYVSELDVDFIYCENVKPLEKILLSMERRDIKKMYSYYDKRNLEEYETDDGYKVSSFYQMRHSGGENCYYLAIAGNGKFISLRLDTLLETDFDDMNIDEYYLDFLRDMK